MEEALDTGSLKAGVPTSAVDERDEHGLFSDVSSRSEAESSLMRLFGTWKWSEGLSYDRLDASADGVVKLESGLDELPGDTSGSSLRVEVLFDVGNWWTSLKPLAGTVDNGTS